jgi:hypothetical protein
VQIGMEPVYTYIHEDQRADVYETGVVIVNLGDGTSQEYTLASLDEANVFASNLLGGA